MSERSPWLDAMFGNIYNDGEPVEGLGGLNFLGGIQATPNPATGVIDITDGIDVLSAWAVPKQTVTAGTPGEWYTLGEYYLRSTRDCGLFAIWECSDPSLTMTLALWDVSAKAIIRTLGPSTLNKPTRSIVSASELAGNKNYQFRAQVSGATGDQYFATIYTAGIY